MHYFKKLLSLSFFIISLSGQALNWAPELSIQLKKISDLNISDKSNKISFVVREALIEGEKSEYLSQIWVANTDGSDLVQFTYDKKSNTHPRFSPDGKYLAFISKRSEKPQIWIMNIAGGGPWQFTHEKQGAGAFHWSPNSKTIAFLMKDPETDEEEKNKKEKRDVILVDKNFKYGHIYTKKFNLKSDTSKAERITNGNYDITNFDWNPNGKNIAFSHRPEPTFNSGFVSGDISMVNLSNKKVKSLVTWEGVDSSPSFSPDGKLIAFTSNGGNREVIGLNDIFVIKTNGGKPRKLSETPNRGRVGIINWSTDSRHVYIRDLDRTQSQLYKIGVQDKSIDALFDAEGFVSSIAISNDETKIIYVKQTVDKPSEVFSGLLRQIKTKRITDFNISLDLPAVTKTEILQWESKDGLEIEGLLTYPANYNKRKKYPLALIIHGGPAGSFPQTFTGNPGIYVVQYFTSKGYAVLRPNPRGSTGYGKDFRYANFKDWGFGDYEDIMSGVDKVIEMGVADQKRLAVMGWSYGGYMTSFVVTRTDRFKAASMGAGLPNLISMTSTTDISNYLVAHMGDEFWNDYKTYEKHSAIYRIKNVVTPTQILHGENDLRVPFTQGQEFYGALKRKGVSTEMVVYPRTPHGPREPKLLMDVSPRILTWLDKYINRSTDR
jgi:dipeptidyl aminopeptidase/acylaminoacyl peptidase